MWLVSAALLVSLGGPTANSTHQHDTPTCLALQLELLNMDPAFLNRNVNEGFSGGEKKRNEILQLAVLEVSAVLHVHSVWTLLLGSFILDMEQHGASTARNAA